VLIADFKTGRPPRDPAAVPEAILAQLAAYRALLARLQPGRPVRCLVIWTAVPEVVEISCAALDAALHLVGSVRESTAVGDSKP
jgi:ATP-dependent helicase/nuclease subunit A